MILQLLMFKVCGVIGISKIEFFNFSSTERVKLEPKDMGLIRVNNKNNLLIFY